MCTLANEGGVTWVGVASVDAVAGVEEVAKTDEVSLAGGATCEVWNVQGNGLGVTPAIRKVATGVEDPVLSEEGKAAVSGVGVFAVRHGMDGTAESGEAYRLRDEMTGKVVLGAGLRR